MRKTDVKTSASVSDALEPKVQQGEKPKSFEMHEHDNNTDEEMMVCEKEGMHEAQWKTSRKLNISPFFLGFRRKMRSTEGETSASEAGRSLSD